VSAFEPSTLGLPASALSAFALSRFALSASCGRAAVNTVVESCTVFSVLAAGRAESGAETESTVEGVSAIAPPLVEESAAGREAGVADVTA
jgi:hypothetical protein